MKSKRLIAMLLAFLLVVVLFAGCGQTKDQPSTSGPAQSGDDRKKRQRRKKSKRSLPQLSSHALTSMIDP